MTPSHQNALHTGSRLRACLFLACSMSLVGSYVALTKPLVLVFPVLLLVWLRFGIGGVAMLGWLKKPADEPPMSRQTQRLLFAECFFGNFLFSICMMFGVQHSSAVAAGVIMAAIPAAVALLSWIFLKEHISARIWLATACAVLGIALVSLSKHAPADLVAVGDSAGKTPWIGNLLLLGAVFCEATYAVIGKKLTGSLSPKRITALINLWGFALVTPFGLWMAWHFDFGQVLAGHWVLLMFYSLAASVWTVWLWMTGLRHVPAAE
ncbi:MAG: DMT family transporter, partial [Pseudomonadota bacterium]